MKHISNQSNRTELYNIHHYNDTYIICYSIYTMFIAIIILQRKMSLIGRNMCFCNFIRKCLSIDLVIIECRFNDQYY